MDNGDALVARPARQRPRGLKRVGPPVPARAVPTASAPRPALRPATLPASTGATLKLALLSHLMATVQKIFAIYEARRRPTEQNVAVEVTSFPATIAAGFANRHVFVFADTWWGAFAPPAHPFWRGSGHGSAYTTTHRRGVRQGRAGQWSRTQEGGATQMGVPQPRAVERSQGEAPQERKGDEKTPAAFESWIPRVFDLPRDYPAQNGRNRRGAVQTSVQRVFSQRVRG